MLPPLSRRNFLQSAVAATTCGLGQASLSAADPKALSVTEQAALPIIDTHQHLWDLGRFRLPWTKGNDRLARNYLMSDYQAATAGLPISQTVYMEVDVDPAQQLAEAEYVLEFCQRADNPMTAAVISGRPGSTDFRDYITRFKGSPYIKGIRQVLHGGSTPAGYCLDPQFVRGVQLLGDLGLSYDLCMRSGELLDGARLVSQCPQTRFIVDHCGNMSVQERAAKPRQQWLEGMRALAEHDRVVCKVSGIVASAAAAWKPADLQPVISDTLKTFGPDRVMFGGDWPVCTRRASYRQWVEALRQILTNLNIGQADQKKLFHDNALRVYGLKNRVGG
jgi:L-fuconolactonase